MRAIQRRRKSRLRSLRWAYAYTHDFITTSFAYAKRRERALWKPLACLRMRLRRRRALKPRLARGMGPYSSTVGEHALDVLLHRRVDHVVLAQATQALARLLLHPVVAARLRALDPALAGHAEPLGSGLVGLHLRHDAGLRSSLRAGRRSA